MKKIISLLGLLASYGIAYGLDLWLIEARKIAERELDVVPVMWISVVAQVVSAAVVLALAWYVLVVRPRDWIVPVLFLVLGLPVLFSPVFYYTSALQEPLATWVYTVASSPLMRMVSSFAVIAGIVGLALPRRENEATRKPAAH